ncbi:hypothetical protein Q764_04450 [Flavobacterium suncheonense GH29-5 = DSM 17707]|uniref:Uncharacterized protein n=1 Tax=Flavobacterium suncheonense GH29-5 = DSM 17707 TaxID=1121899 RepID=A0A0A2ME24_9FLAO|nr:hypothetical protein Q764_04450 [Flavobacterium suncheonense GH29-5 = DSM 17707]
MKKAPCAPESGNFVFQKCRNHSLQNIQNSFFFVFGSILLLKTLVIKDLFVLLHTFWREVFPLGINHLYVKRFCFF